MNLALTFARCDLMPYVFENVFEYSVNVSFVGLFQSAGLCNAASVSDGNCASPIRSIQIAVSENACLAIATGYACTRQA